MSKITTTGQRLPTISRALAFAIWDRGDETRFGPAETPEERAARMRRGDPAPGMVIRIPPQRPSQAVIDEAARILPSLEVSMQPADRETVLRASERILLNLNGAVANPFSTDAARARACLLANAAYDLPAGVWDEALDRKLLKAFKFMPSVAELVAILEAEIQPIRDKIARVRMVSMSQPPAVRESEKVDRPDPAELERRRAVIAEMNAAAEARDREDAEIREFGMWMPAGSEGKAGLELAADLRSRLPELDGPKKRITERRIENLERNAAVLAQLERMGK